MTARTRPMKPHRRRRKRTAAAAAVILNTSSGGYFLGGTSSVAAAAPAIPPPSFQGALRRRRRLPILSLRYGTASSSVAATSCSRLDAWIDHDVRGLLLYSAAARSSTTLSASTGVSEVSERSSEVGATVGDYARLLRPVTLLQAVGALAVGYFALLAPGYGSGGGGMSEASAAGIFGLGGDRTGTIVRLLSATLALYLSYGCGMVMNDIIDRRGDADHMDESKRSRPLALGTISTKQGWMYAAILSAASLALGWCGGGVNYALWTGCNLAIMLAYALGLQRVLVVKNVVVGYLSVSPLLGAALLAPASAIGSGAATGASSSLAAAAAGEGVGRLWRLASVGFPVSISREILKDVEDVDSDRGRKLTLPHAVGERAACAIAFALAWVTCGVLCLPSYRSMFVSSGRRGLLGMAVPWYGIGHAVGSGMVAKANLAGTVEDGQRMLKKAIYVLLGGMIAGLLT